MRLSAANANTKPSATNRHTSDKGQERRPLQQTAARQLPLCFDSDRDRAAVQYVAKGQKRSFDHLVGAGEHRWRHIEAEHIGGPAPVLLPLAVDFLTLGVKQAKVNGL